MLNYQLNCERPTTPLEPAEPVPCESCTGYVGDADLEYCDKCSEPLCLDCATVIDDESLCRKCVEQRKPLEDASITLLAERLHALLAPQIPGFRIAGIRPPKADDIIWIELPNGGLITKALSYAVETALLDETKPHIILEVTA